MVLHSIVRAQTGLSNPYMLSLSQSGVIEFFTVTMNQLGHLGLSENQQCFLIGSKSLQWFVKDSTLMKGPMVATHIFQIKHRCPHPGLCRQG